MIENQLLQHLMADEALGKMLATHNEKPAVFEQVVPSDNNAGWAGRQYSRIVFDINTEESPTRKATGTLSVDIECTDSSTPFDEISPVLKAVIDGYFFASDDSTAVAARWLSTDNFTTDDTHKIFGSTQTYDLYAFPAQTVGDDMDPVALVNSETKKLLPESKVIAVDSFDDAWAPTDKTPAVYWRLSDVRSDPVMSRHDNWAVSWLQATLQGHAFAPTQMRRNGIIKTLGEDLCQGQRLIFPDGSPFCISNMRIDNGADPLKSGQITIVGSYGILHAQMGGGAPFKSISIR